MAEIILYHGTVESKAIDIISEQKFNDSDGEKHYLGRGIYLYDDLEQAIVWAKLKRNDLRKKGIYDRYAIIECIVDIELEEIFDLDKRAYQDFFFKERNNYINLIKNASLEYTYYNDRNFFNFLFDTADVQIISKTFPYIHPKEKQVRYLLSNDKTTHRDVTRHYRTEKQYCVRDSSIIKSIKLFNPKED